MERIKINGRYFRTLITKQQIDEAVDKVAVKVNEDYRDSKKPPMLMCILNGAIPFTAALMQRLEFDNELVCMKVSSYNGTTDTTGHVITKVKPTADVSGRDILICEDIVDTGITIRFLRKYLIEQGATDVKVCCLMYKPEKLRGRLIEEGLLTPESSYEQFKAFEPEYYALQMPNDFLVGFGLDYDEIGRHHKDIYTLDE